MIFSALMDDVFMPKLNHSLIPHATPVYTRGRKIGRMSTLSERIIEAMEKSGVSVKQVADACGISYQAVRKWRIKETQSLDGKHLVALAKLTGYECEWLMTGTGPKHRLYAKNQPQSLALQAMEKLPQEDQYKIPAFVDLFTESASRKKH